MKAYFFVSPYLSDIQKGIQVSHCMAEMSLKAMCDPKNEVTGSYSDWAIEHKTVVVLDYGTDKRVVDLLIDYLLRNKDIVFWSVFEERELNYLPTLGVILSDDDVREVYRYRNKKRFIFPTWIGYTSYVHDKRHHVEIHKSDWKRGLMELYEEGHGDKITWPNILSLISTLRPA